MMGTLKETFSDILSTLQVSLSLAFTFLELRKGGGGGLATPSRRRRKKAQSK